MDVYFCCMKRLLKTYRRWRYRRLYRKLLYAYLKFDHLNAPHNASVAFQWITGYEWEEIIAPGVEEKTVYRLG